MDENTKVVSLKRVYTRLSLTSNLTLLSPALETHQKKGQQNIRLDRLNSDLNFKGFLSHFPDNF